MVLMKKEIFYLLGPKGDGCETLPAYGSEASYHFPFVRLPWRCNNCGQPFDGTKGVDIKIDVTEKYLAKQRPLTFADCLHVDLIWEPFIRTVPTHILDRDIHFGNVLRPDGTHIEDWLTCRCRYDLQLRGTGKGGTSVRKITICKDCGYVRWSSQSPFFLYPAPPDDADIFQCSGDLLFRESVYQYLDMEQWKKKVYVTKIKVADKPLDGLDLPQFEIPRDLKWVAEHPEIERC